MYNFFVEKENAGDGCYFISDSDRNHIVNVLRMDKGDRFLVSCEGKSDLCILAEISECTVTAEIIEENYNDTELPAKIYLYQGLPKSDKMELIIQKAVELGVYSIIPTEMRNCVVRLEDKKRKSKTARWQAISEAAAKQSKRNIIPEVRDVTSFKEAMKQVQELDMFIVPYENEKIPAGFFEETEKLLTEYHDTEYTAFRNYRVEQAGEGIWEREISPLCVFAIYAPVHSGWLSDGNGFLYAASKYQQLSYFVTKDNRCHLPFCEAYKEGNVIACYSSQKESAEDGAIPCEICMK